MTEAAAPKKSAMKPVVIIAATLVVGLGGGIGGAWFLLGGPSVKSVEIVAAPPEYYSIEQNLTSNLKDSDRLIQVKIALAYTGGDPVVKTIEQQMPAIVASSLTVLSETTEEDISSQDGRLQLGKNILRAIRQITNNAPGAPGVQDVLLTGLILQ